MIGVFAKRGSCRIFAHLEVFAARSTPPHRHKRRFGCMFFHAPFWRCALRRSIDSHEFAQCRLVRFDEIAALKLQRATVMI